ncbi:MAG: helix-turn-helix transcriptional regulator [Isosphaeraceae bacterium]
MSVARQIRDLRYIKGWGPHELADRAQISRTALYQIESGKTEMPRAATLTRIAQALEIPIESLIIQQEPNPTASPTGFVEDRRQFGRTVPSRAPREASSRDVALNRKFRELLDSPLGQGLAQIVDQVYVLIDSDSHRPLADQTTPRAR